MRAVWDDGNSCRWFSATDVVRAISDEPDYTKAGRWLKRKLKQEIVLKAFEAEQKRLRAKK